LFRDRTGRIAEADHQTAWLHGIQRGFPGVLAHAVIHHRHFLAAGQCQHALGHVLVAVVDGFPCAVLARQLGFFGAGHGTDQLHAQGAGPLACKQANAAGRSVEQDGFIALQAVGLAQQVLHRQALQHRRRSLLEADPRRQRDQLVLRHVAYFGVGADRALPIGHAVADLQARHARPHGFDHAGALEAQAMRQRTGIQPGAEIDIDVVQADRMLADGDLVRAGRGHVHVDELHDFRSAVLIDPDCLGH
jgi:hypothetical protein